MINLVSTSPNYLSTLNSEFVGYLGTPRTRHIIPSDLPFALDNDCFSEYNPARIIRNLKAYKHMASRCLFAVVPDSVGNAVKTTTLFKWWYHVFKRYGYKIAYVIQDFVTMDMIPYDKIDAIFIGGSTEFKLSSSTAGIVADAKNQKLWVHMGRVNSAKRIKYAQSIGCDSFDGTAFSMYSKTYIRKLLPYHSNYQHNFLE